MVPMETQIFKWGSIWEQCIPCSFYEHNCYAYAHVWSILRCVFHCQIGSYVRSTLFYYRILALKVHFHQVLKLHIFTIASSTSSSPACFNIIITLLRFKDQTWLYNFLPVPPLICPPAEPLAPILPFTPAPDSKCVYHGHRKLYSSK